MSPQVAQKHALLRCGDLPAGTSCAFEPQTVNTGEGGAVSRLTIATTGPTILGAADGRARGLPWAYLVFGLAMAAVSTAAAGRRRATTC